MNIFRVRLLIVLMCFVLSDPGLAADVLTYHNNNQQTGLNSQESTLTPWNVNVRSFG